MRPVLKWAGGKRQILPFIRKYINDNTLSENSRYYEPFLGGGSVLLDIQRNNCVVNDYNAEIINVYKVIRDHPVGLIRMLKYHQKHDSDDYYYQVRELDKSKSYEKMGIVKKAARTIYLNKTCFNGLYRVNRNGFFNTPRGKYSNPLICDTENIMQVSKYLRDNNISILNCDFEDACPGVKEGDYVYLDPPYDYEGEMGFVSYVADGFSRNDLVRLKEFCDRIIKKGARVLISNNDTSFVRELFSGDDYQVVYQINQISASRSINSSGKKRSKKAQEVLIYGSKKSINTIPTS